MKAMELNAQNFEREAMQAKETVLVDFWAPWCGPCRMLSPIVEEIAQEGHEGLKVCKVNVDEQPELAARFGVMSIPTLVALKDGKALSTAVGARPKQAILDWLNVR